MAHQATCSACRSWLATCDLGEQLLDERQVARDSFLAALGLL
jgi:hypothetical protein